jgi:hypothetical protein
VRYASGQAILPGDVVKIDSRHEGIVVGNIESLAYLPPHNHEQWGYLRSGVVIDTSFGGLVHYPDDVTWESEQVVLVRRGSRE